MVKVDSSSVLLHKIESLEASLNDTRVELGLKFKELGVINEIVRAIHSTLDLRELEKIIRNILKNSIKLSNYSLRIYDPYKKIFELEIARNIDKELVEKVEAKIPFLQKEHPDFHTITFREDGRRHSLMYIPLRAHQNFVGVLFSKTKAVQNLTEDQKEILSVITNQAAVAIENSLLFNMTKKLAVIDSQTSLFNHRHLKNSLQIELRRAKRYKRPLCLIMADIDNFKIYNDTFGHPAGDKLLYSVGKILKQNCREVDIAARYGGDEFAIILPETSKAGALVACEKIRKAVYGATSKKRVSVTISLGIANFPRDTLQSKELIDYADKALYLAKQTGQNKTVPFQKKILNK